MTGALPGRWWPCGLLALLAGVTVAVKDSPGADLALCAVLAVWLLVVHAIPPAWRDREPLMAGYLAGLVLLFGVLVVGSPWFGFFSPAAYVYAFRLLRWPWQPYGVGAVAVVAGTAQAYGVDKTTAAGLITYLAVVAANLVPMCGYSWVAERAARQHQERERVLTEAREANRLLAHAMAENLALHEQLLAQARDSAVQEERQRMAREIHDTLAQGLTGIISQLRAAEHAGEAGQAGATGQAGEVGHTGADGAGWRKHVAAADKLARESLSEARRSVHALRPEPLRSARLGEALAGVAEHWSALHEIPVQVTTTGEARPLPPEAEAALLRIAQEALANVAKHARATKVGLTLSYLAQETALDVRDNGLGFDPSQLATADDPDTEHGGFGLISMRQRMESLSGTLQVESEPGAGTGISARVPAEPAEVTA